MATAPPAAGGWTREYDYRPPGADQYYLLVVSDETAGAARLRRSERGRRDVAQEVGREAAAWLLRSWRRGRTRGGRLRRRVWGQGYHWPPRVNVMWGEIDPNMRALVWALNAIGGIQTVACCGGHASPTRSQQPAGQWFVAFEASGGLGSWLAALARLRGAVAETRGVRLEENRDGYFLSGRDGADPEALAGRLAAAVGGGAN